MISSNDIHVTKNDLSLFITIVIVTNLFEYKLVGAALFDEKWMNSSVALLLGVALHGLLTNKLSAMVNTQLNIQNVGLKNSVYDFFKFGTIFVCQRSISSYIEAKPIVFDREWMMNTGLTIAGYSAYNVVLAPVMPAVDPKFQPLFNDLVKVSLGDLTAKYFISGTITQKHLMTLSGLLASFVVFHLVVKQLVFPSEGFSNNARDPRDYGSI
jgi:hypothetical protein